MMRNSVKKWDFRPLYFAQKCPQNAGNAVSETQRNVLSHLACRPKIGKSRPENSASAQTV